MGLKNIQERIIAVKELMLNEVVEQKIFLVRGKRVMLDKELANLYGVSAKVLNQAVRRNIYRFPEDFMFRLSQVEFKNLRYQFGTSSWGGRRYLPYVFTEQGVAMLSSILNSKRAVLVNIQIVRAFVKLREVLSTHKKLAEKLGLLERRVGKHDKKIRAIFQTIQELIEAPPPPEEPPKRRIGFHRG